MELDRLELEYPEQRRLRRRPQAWLQLTLLIGFLFCLLLGVGALAALMLLQTEPAIDENASPLASFPRQQIIPHHALAQLAGDPPAALAFQALQAGELDTAFAISLFTTELADTQRLALFLQLARRYVETERPEEAILAYHLARSTAILGASLTTLERSQALLQIAEGLLDAGNREAALDAAVQARRLAVQTPDLLPAQRSQVFESLRPIARQLEDPAFLAEINDLVRNPYLSPSGVLLVSHWLTLTAALTETMAPDPAVSAAVAARTQAARVLADRIAFTGGVDIDPERQTLAAALLAEDQARGAAFQRTLAAGLSLNQQFGLLLERRSWLALQTRIALGGFGLSLVPEWEANAQTLRDELASTTTNLMAVVEAITASLPEPADQALLRAQALTWLAQQAELGMLPPEAPGSISEELRVAQTELARLGRPLALPVGFEREATPPGYRYIPPETVQ
ncbi:MAG TPA: hypothetical protein VNK95_23435 [Caldilineaceae bacterium]|nr:hypothetical protein [Caldilineaceae bacterium]